VLGCACAHCGAQPIRLSGPWEHGTPGTDEAGNSRRLDIIRLRDAIRSGKRKRELVDDNELALTLSKYPRFVDQCYELFPSLREGAPEVELHYGPPGCGKTRVVTERCVDLWKAPLGKGGWFNRYDGHPDVLMDDFAGKMSHTSLTDLLRLLDRYPESVPTKGGFCAWKPKRVFITTNIHPFDWYEWAGREVHYPALRRRFTRIIAWRSNGLESRTLNALEPQFDDFWEKYSSNGLSATSERTWDSATMSWVLRSTPGTWRDKFDFLFR